MRDRWQQTRGVRSRPGRWSLLAATTGTLLLLVLATASPGYQATDAPKHGKPAPTRLEIQQAIAQLQDSSTPQQRAAALLLGRPDLPPDLQTPAVLSLLTAMRDRELYFVTTKSLREIGPPAVTPLVTILLNNEDYWRRRAGAAETLGHIEITSGQQQVVFSALLRGVTDGNPSVIHSCRDALLRHGVKAIPYLMEAAATDSLELQLAALTTIAQITQTQGSQIDPETLKQVETTLQEMRSHDDPHVRYEAFSALNQLLEGLSNKDDDAHGRWIIFVMSARDHNDPAVRELVRRAYSLLLEQTTTTQLQGPLLRHSDPLVRRFAVEALRERSAISGIDALQEALSSEQDSQLQSILTSALNQLVPVRDRQYAGQRQIWLYLAVFSVLIVPAGLFIGWRWMHRREVEMRAVENRAAVEEIFGLTDDDLQQPEYQRVGELMAIINLREDRSDRLILNEFMTRLTDKLNISPNNIRGPFFGKERFVTQILESLNAGTLVAATALIDDPLIHIPITGLAGISIHCEQLHRVSLPRTSELVVNMLQPDWNDRIASASKIFSYMMEKWGFEPQEIRDLSSELRITLCNAVLQSGKDSHRTLSNISHIKDLFDFLTNEHMKPMAPSEKTRLIILVTMQDEELRTLQEKIAPSILEPVRVKNMLEFSRRMSLSKEIIRALMYHYEQIIVDLWASDTQKKLITDELIRDRKEYLLDTIQQRVDGVTHSIEVDAVKILMKAGPVARVIRTQSEEIKNKISAMEHGISRDDIRMLIHLLEVALLPKEQLESLRTNLKQQITPRDIEAFVEGLSPARIREMVAQGNAAFRSIFDQRIPQ